MINRGWKILEPHGPASFKIESIRNAKGQNGLLVGLSAALTMGASLISSAVGFYKWWTSSLILRYKRLSDQNSEETAHFWMDPANNYEWVITQELK